VRLSFRLRYLCLLIAVSSMCRGGTVTDEIIARVQDRYNSARTLSVHFVENYSILGHPRPAEFGTLTLRKQGKMRWDYSRPEGKLFISDGKEVFLYTARDNRVEKVPLKATEDMRAPLAFLLGRLDMKKEFKDFQTRPSENGTWLEASAKTDRLPYDKIRMLVSADGSIEKLNIVGRDQSLLSYAFSDEKLNAHVNDDLFRFQIPPGATVVNALDYKSPGNS
jgi:outer membrane lipoprotein carrier protein